MSQTTSSPCGGCPPCCNACVFAAAATKTVTSPREIVSKNDYGCVRPDGGAVVLEDGKLGMMRGSNFHPVTESGAAFLRATENPLAAHC